MEIYCKFDELIDPKKLKNNPRNRNKHGQDQIDRLAELYKYHGIRHPIIVSNLSKSIVAGHGRKMAAIRAGLKEMPVVYQDFKDAESEYAFVQADNAIALWAELDVIGIKNDALEFPDLDIKMLGIRDFNKDDVNEKGLTDPDSIPEVVEPKAKLGQIYQLGEHRLMCGDSTNEQMVSELMNGEKADITFTSPPYNAGKNIRGNFYENDSDDKSEDDYVNFLNKFTENCLTFSDFVFVNIQILESNKKAVIRYQYDNIEKIKDILIWNKTQYPPHINKGTFGCKWEYVLCFNKEGKSRSFPCSWQGKFPNVIETENNSNNEFAEKHKAGFPVAFPVWLIEKMDFANSVYDPFMGTGTTLIACEKLNLKSYGMELDPHYVDVIIARWEAFTGKTAVLLEQKASNG